MSVSLFTGTYTRGASKGIYLYDLDPEQGSCRLRQLLPAANPSYLAFSKTGDRLYAVNESSDLAGDTLTAFRQQNGSWEPVATVNTRGVDPCYVALSQNGRHLFTANYSNGSISVFALDASGIPSARPVQFLSYSGNGPNLQRQENAHLHCTSFSPDGRYLFAADLGADRVYVFHYNDTLEEPLEQVSVTITEPGSGPRHIVFNEAGTVAYLVLELTGKVAVYRHEEGRLEEIQVLAMEDDGFSGAHCAAAIHLSSDGRFLYTSNRGDSNALSVFEVHPQSGVLSRIQRVPGGGSGPRNFTLSPCGRFLLVANQYTGDVRLFDRDTASGLLSHRQQLFTADSPVFLALR